jgi:hypothetical protein
MKLGKKIIALALFGMAVSGFAQTRANGCNDSGCTGKVSALYVNAQGNIYVSTDQDEKLPDCDPVGGIYFHINGKKPGAKNMYSALLTASTTNQKVFFRVVQQNKKCEMAYVVAYANK